MNCYYSSNQPLLLMKTGGGACCSEQQSQVEVAHSIIRGAYILFPQPCNCTNEQGDYTTFVHSYMPQKHVTNHIAKFENGFQLWFQHVK